VPGAAFRRLNDALQALVADTGLVGCNSLDFLLEDDRPAVLEVNPRPSATMDLYDRDWRDGLFDAHVRACRGSLPKVFRPMRGKPVRAHAIVYAGVRLRIAPDTEFAAWCSDIPRSGSDVQIDAPVCTVHAGGVDPQVALRQLGRRRRQAERNLARQHDSEETGNEFKDQATECESHRGSPGCIAAGTSR
jgi:predicted ATP-grasp superfamily ATP-dependent carboligase